MTATPAVGAHPVRDAFVACQEELAHWVRSYRRRAGIARRDCDDARRGAGGRCPPYDHHGCESWSSESINSAAGPSIGDTHASLSSPASAKAACIATLAASASARLSYQPNTLGPAPEMLAPRAWWSSAAC